jgi:hypothetical protein
MQDFEKLGVFYLGKEYDLSRQALKENFVLYDSKDLTTHAVCVGMTGSGKTGLCIGLLEEAAIDGIPAIVIDPKGDMADLLLQFPDLRPRDFQPWVNPDDARRKGLTVEQYAAEQAESWKKGLEEWGESGERIQKLARSAEFTVYTPGSSAGKPVSILQSFEAPAGKVLEDADLTRELVSTTASSLLGLVGVDADPVKSREHILLSTLLGHFWGRGKALTLATLIQSVQNPPFAKVGVFDVDSFYPPKERFALAVTLNNLIASPSFRSWSEGEPFDAAGFLYTESGKPRVSVFSIAHLSDPERMFFVSLLLNRVLGWMRAQPGTTSLRAILYFDELFGYMPPTADPASKKPLLTLLKQGRAFGLGCVLATQNPVDLDYKGLSNAGTWFIGRLQTERDRARMLDGLESAAAGRQAIQRADFEKMIGGLGNRVFLMHNVHEDAPVVFQSRQALSYLAGPLTRAQLKDLVPERKSAPPRKDAVEPEAAPGSPGASSSAPNLNPKIPQFFIPFSAVPAGKPAVTYRPFAWAGCKLHFVDAARNVDLVRPVRRIAPFAGGAVTADWDRGETVGLDPRDLRRTPEGDARFESLPFTAEDLKSVDEWAKGFETFVSRSEKLTLFESRVFKAVSRPGESERDFRARLRQSLREGRDAHAGKLRAKYAKDHQVLEEKIRVAEQRLEREKGQVAQQGLSTAISFGATILGAFLGRKRISAATISKAGTTARSASRTIQETGDVKRAQETLEGLKRQMAGMEAAFERDAGAGGSGGSAEETFDTVDVWPKKGDTETEMTALVWAPLADGKEAWR